MKKLLTLTALIGATTVAMTACGGESLAEVTAHTFTQERIAEYAEEFKDANFETAKHTLSTNFALDKEIKTMREGYVNTPVGESFWTVFQVTKFGTWNTIDLTDWNQFKSSNLLTWSQYLLTSYLPTTNQDKITANLNKVADPLASSTLGEIYLAKVYVDVFYPSTTKQITMFKKTGQFDVYGWGQETDGSVEPNSKYPTFDVNSKEMYKLN